MVEICPMGKSGKELGGLPTPCLTLSLLIACLTALMFLGRNF